jgi:hypothetical protein
MNKVYNFGSSHSLGWNAKTSYSKIIAKRLDYEWNNHAMAGASLEYILMKLYIAEPMITKDDIVLIQIPGFLQFSMHADPRIKSETNQFYKLYHATSYTLLDQEPECDFIYGLKYYKSIVQNKDDQALHYYIQLRSLIKAVQDLPCKYFMFFCEKPEQPETTIFLLNQLYERSKSELIDSINFVDFAKSLTFEDKYTVDESGNIDKGHYNEKVHTMWANYIMKKL